MRDGGAFGAMDERRAVGGVEELEAGGAERAGVVLENAGAAQAEEVAVAMAGVVDQPWLDGFAPVAGTTVGGNEGEVSGFPHVF